MSISTKDKIEFLQGYIKEWHKSIKKSHVENIVGFRIGKKKRAGNEVREYSIIVQVAKKYGENQLESKAIIPKQVQILFPDGRSRLISTDVEETGTFKFQSALTGEVKSKYSIHFGSTGLFVVDDEDRLYAITNYHVVAEAMLIRRKLQYSRPPSMIRMDVRLTDTNGRMTEGRFELGLLSHQIDAAFIELFVRPSPELNRLPDNRRVNGRVSVRPLPPSLRNKRVVVYSYFNPMGAESIVSDNSSVLYTDDPRIFFEDVIQIRPRVTQGGDSGGLVLMTSLSVLGIIVGADNLSTYAIPFYKIDDFKNVIIL